MLIGNDVSLGIKAVIFDVDGTLLKTYEDLANAVNFALSTKGFPQHNPECFKLFAGNGTDMMIKRALPEEFRNDKTVDELRPIYFEYYNKHSGEMTKPYDDILQLLSNLKKNNLKLGVVSNKIDFMTKIVIKEYFGDMFDYVTGQCEGVPIKPDPAMLNNAMAHFGVSPDECIFIGDSGVDALTGKNAGVFTVGVLWGFRDETELKENGANVVINTPLELLKYINY